MDFDERIISKHFYFKIKDSVAVCRFHDKNYVKGQIST